MLMSLVPTGPYGLNLHVYSSSDEKLVVVITVAIALPCATQARSHL